LGYSFTINSQEYRIIPKYINWGGLHAALDHGKLSVSRHFIRGHFRLCHSGHVHGVNAEFIYIRAAHHHDYDVYRQAWPVTLAYSLTIKPEKELFRYPEGKITIG
jgi:hypothetical protein